MLKKILTFCLVLLLAGCNDQVNYERSTESGVIKQITMEEVQNRIDNKETFMFVFTQESCHNCADFKENILNEYIADHGFEFNEVVLSLDMDTAPVFDWVKKHPNPTDQLEEGLYPEDVLTPAFYFIENGEVKDIYIGANMTKKILEEMVVKYQLDEAK